MTNWEQEDKKVVSIIFFVLNPQWHGPLGKQGYIKILVQL